MKVQELTSAELILEWANTANGKRIGTRIYRNGYTAYEPVLMDDTETAAYLSECVRLRAAFDDMKIGKGTQLGPEEIEGACAGQYDDAYYLGWEHGGDDLLRELRNAMKEGSK